MQTVYLRVWDKAGQFDGTRASPITWLATIARNAAIDWKRSVAGRPIAAASLDEGKADQVADDAPRADVLLLASERNARLHHCINTLEVRTGACIRAAFFDGMTYAELAALEDVPLGTMKSWMRRGLLKLKDCLGDG